jgi:translocation and assembly module TamA
MRFSVTRFLVVVGITLCSALPARAADPQPYHIEFASTGDDAIDSTLKATSELESLRDSAPVSPFGLIARARSDVERLKSVLESFGYYQSSVTIKIDDTPLNDAGLGDALSALPKDRDARVAVSFALGPLYRLRRIDIDGELPESARGVLGLNSGDPASASAVLAAGARLLTALQEQGYAFAQVDEPIAHEDQNEPVLDVSFHVVAGARVKIGEIHIVGLKRVHESLVRERLLLKTGVQYSPTQIEMARRDLLGLGVFGAVSVKVGSAVDGSGGVPITFDVRERLRHAATINAAYSTDLGGSGGITWTDRDVFGSAQQLTIAASAINLGGSATTGLGYNTSAKYITPDFGRRDQSLQIAVGAIKQSLTAYDQTATTSGVTLNRKLSSIWSASVGVSTANEHIIQENTTHDYTLVGLPLGVTLDSTNLSSPLDDPRHGMRASLSVTPTRSFGNPSANFIISQIKVAGYLDLQALTHTDPGRSVLAARALEGLAQGAGEFSLPPDQRFYGGGSGTIRGYAYQAVGPKFPDGKPIGGTAIVAGSLEWRRRIGKNFGAAVFVDGGQVSTSLKLLPSAIRIGAGLGLRYYTPIGPIRLDIAVPTKRDPTDDLFEIYIGLGQAF